jgi:lantibiotic modifying enzyme
VALALACAGRALPCAESSRLATNILKDSLPLLPRHQTGNMPLPNPGYDQGMAGILHAFEVCAHLTGDTSLWVEARALARDWLATFAPGQNVKPGQCLDLLNGVAGFLLVLLRWHRADPGDGAFLQAARACGDHLLKEARTEATGVSWGEPGKPGLSGLSHGGSGFALALISLYRATGHLAYRELAFDALAYEATLFVPQWANWRDLRGFEGGDVKQVQHCGCSWCHGAPGIALARAALLHLLVEGLSGTERSILEQELEVALATTCDMLKHETGPKVDDLCCGSAGSIDILLECARLLDRPELAQIAQHEAHRRVQAWTSPLPERQEPRYWFTNGNMAGTSLALFKGITGQVYLQARLADPETVPCVLLPL